MQLVLGVAQHLFGLGIDPEEVAIAQIGDADHGVVEQRPLFGHGLVTQRDVVDHRVEQRLAGGLDRTAEYFDVADLAAGEAVLEVE